MKRWLAFFSLLAVALAALAWPGATGAQSSERCFPETGYCIRGQVRDYWERNGGLAVFGYPIGAEIPNETVEGSWVGRTQWFERDRLEVHANGVMAGRMGAQLLELHGRSWYEFPQFVGELPAGCVYFDATRHSLCEPFLSYWERNGGLERFGYPLAEPMNEQLGGWSGTVQYFERRRMEHHLELRGTRYEVLLGLLGRAVYDIAPPVLCTTPLADELAASLATDPLLRENLGCPVLTAADAPAAVQTFDNGSMLWADLGAGGKKIYTVYSSPYAPGRPLVYAAYDDTWTSADPADYGLNPPAGHYPPMRGFGKLWVSNKFVRQDLGWGTAPEQPARAVVQQFGSGAAVLWLRGTSIVYVLGAKNGTVRLLSYSR
jgi:hypothetical protein